MRPALLAIAASGLALGARAALQGCDENVINPSAFGFQLTSDIPEVQIARGEYAFFTIDRCNGCSGGFAVGDLDDAHKIDILGMTAVEFEKFQAGTSYSTISALSTSSASACAGTGSLSAVTAPTYVVIRCAQDSPADCAVVWGLQTTPNSAAVASCASPYQAGGRTYETGLTDSGEYYEFNGQHPKVCGASGSCTDVSFAISSDQDFTLFATDSAGKTAIESAQPNAEASITKYSGAWDASSSTRCHSAGGFSTPAAAGNEFVLFAKCGAPFGQQCKFASTVTYTKNPNGVVDDDSVLASQCQTDAAAAFSTFTTQTLAAGEWFWGMHIDRCGSGGSCTDVKYAVQSTSETASPFSVYLVPSIVKQQVENADASWMTDGSVLMKKVSTSCEVQTGYTTAAAGGHAMYVAVVCEGGGTDGCSFEHNLEYTPNPSAGANDDDDAATCTNPDTAFPDTASSVGFADGGVEAMKLLHCGPKNNGQCTNVNWAIERADALSKFDVFVTDFDGYMDIVGGTGASAPKDAEETGLGCSEKTGYSTPSGYGRKVFVVIKCARGDGNDCNLKYGFSYDYDSNYDGTSADDAVVDDDGGASTDDDRTQEDDTPGCGSPASLGFAASDIKTTDLVPYSSFEEVLDCSSSGCSGFKVAVDGSQCPSRLSAWLVDATGRDQVINGQPVTSSIWKATATKCGFSTDAGLDAPSVSTSTMYLYVSNQNSQGCSNIKYAVSYVGAPSPSPSIAPDPSSSPSTAVSASPSEAGTSVTASPSVAPSVTPSVSFSATSAPTQTPSPTALSTPSATVTPSSSVSPSPSVSASPSVSPSAEPTPSPSMSSAPTPTPSPSSAPRMCAEWSRVFAPEDVKRVALGVGEVMLANISGCGDAGSCTSVRFMASTTGRDGSGVVSVFAALTAQEASDAVRDRAGLISAERAAWTHSETRCAFEDAGLTTPSSAGDRMWLAVVCPPDAPGPCNVDFALTYEPFVPATASPGPIPPASSGVTTEQLEALRQIQSRPYVTRVRVGGELHVPVMGCGGGRCRVDFAAAVVGGAGTLQVSSAPKPAEGLFRRLADADMVAGTGVFVRSVGVLTPAGSDGIDIAVGCAGDPTEYCDVEVAAAWVRPGPDGALAPETPAEADRAGPGSTCQTSTQCATGSCRGGVCCDEAAGSATSSCAACGAGAGACAVGELGSVQVPVTTCSDPMIDAVCGVERGADFSCTTIVGGSGGVRVSGRCVCGDQTRFWGTGQDASSLPVCPAYVEHVKDDSKATLAVFASKGAPAPGGSTPGGDGDGGAAAAGGIVGGLVAIGVGALLYTRHRQIQADSTPLSRARRTGASTGGFAGAISAVFGRGKGKANKWETVDETDIPDLDDDDDDAETAGSGATGARTIAPGLAFAAAMGGSERRAFFASRARPTGSAGSSGASSPDRGSPSGSGGDQFNPLHSI